MSKRSYSTSGMVDKYATQRMAARRRRLLRFNTRAVAGGRPTARFGQRVPPPGNFQPTGSEIKAIDIAIANYLLRAPATASNIILLNGVAAGTGFFNRVGARTEMKNIHMRGYITNTATAVGQNGRILIVYDRQPTPVAGLPVISEILQSRDQAGAATTTSQSEINLDNRDRFVILRDLEFYLPSVTNTANVLTNGPQFDGEANMQINEFIKLKGLGTHYKSTAAPTTITDIATGALYACFVSVADSTWTATVGFRLRYQDK